jgi:Ni/Co efflux regulator RcnB
MMNLRIASCALSFACLIPAPAASAPKAAEYHFRDGDRAKLREHYDHIERVDTTHRGRYVAGAHLPADFRKHLRPVPKAVVQELPPPPPGYVFGYIEGYCVVYDPATLLVAGVIDLTSPGGAKTAERASVVSGLRRLC